MVQDLIGSSTRQWLEIHHRSANDRGPQMNPNCTYTADDPRTESDRWKCLDSGIWTVDLNSYNFFFFITMTLGKPGTLRFDSEKLLCTEVITINFGASKKTSKL